MQQKPRTPQKGALKGIRDRFDKLRKRRPSDSLMEKLNPERQRDEMNSNKKVAQPPKKRSDLEI